MNLFFIILYFVTVGSFTTDGGLLQPTEGVKTTPQKTRFRNVNLYKEFAYKSKIELMVTATTIELTTRSTRAKTNNV